MKIKFLLFAAILGFSFVANADNITKNYDLRFDGIEVSNKFEIQLMKADQHSVTIDVDSEYAPYLSVTTESGILKVKFKKLPVKMKMSKSKFRMTVRTPMINFIDISDACTLICRDEFTLGMNNFRVSASGSSEIRDLRVNSVDAAVSVTGASKVVLDGQFSDLEIKIDGASKVTYNGSCSDLDAEVYASSELKVTGGMDDVDINVRGASKVEMMGHGTVLEVEVGGASKFNGTEFAVETADVVAKGASSVTVNASEALKATISGASSCKYKEYEGLRVNPSVDGHGTFKTL